MPSHTLYTRTRFVAISTVVLLLTLYDLPASARGDCKDNDLSNGYNAAQYLGRGINLGYALEQCLNLPESPRGRNCDDDKDKVEIADAMVEEMTDPNGKFWTREEIIHAESFRLPVAWWHHHEKTKDGGIRVRDAYFTLVDQAIRTVRRVRPDVVLVINLHEFNKIIGNPEKTKKHYDKINKRKNSDLDDANTQTSKNSKRKIRTPREDLILIWQDIATRLKGYAPGCVYFELLNEPQGKYDGKKKRFTGYCASDWREDSAELVRKIRKTGGNNSDRPLIISTCNPDDYKDLGGLIDAVVRPLQAEFSALNPLIVTWHYYDPFRATHWRNRCPQEGPKANKDKTAKYGLGCGTNPIKADPYLLHDAPMALDKTGPDGSLWQTNIARTFKTVRDATKDLSIGIYLGEFGYERYIKRNWWPMKDEFRELLRANRKRWICEMVAQAEANGMSYGLWNISASFGVSQTGALTKEEKTHNKEIYDLALPGKRRLQGTSPQCSTIL